MCGGDDSRGATSRTSPRRPARSEAVIGESGTVHRSLPENHVPKKEEHAPEVGELRQTLASKPMNSHELDTALAELADLNWPELRQRWTEVTGRPVPKVKHALLRMALGFELQASVYGGLSRRTAERLAQMGAATTSQPKTTKLVREWKGTLHTVTVMEDETVHWNGKQWRSLSEVAREITGTRWSGPAFFGLKKRKAA